MQGQPIQIITALLRIDVPIEDLSTLDKDSQDEQVAAALRRGWEHPLEFSRAPLLRMRLLKLGEQDHVLLRTVHHIVSDGWSQGVFNRELCELYEAFHEGRENPLEALPVQYADFALWQREWLQEERLRRDLEYWEKQLEGAPEQLQLPTDRPRG